MPTLALNDIQKAIYQRLTGDSGLMAQVSGVYDHVPHDAIFPYISVYYIKSTDWSTRTTRGVECEMQISVWSREGGRKQTAAIMNTAFNLLHDASFAVDNNTLVLSRMVGSSIELENDGLTYEGRMQLRMLLENN